MTGCKCELRYSVFSFWCCINRLYHDFIVKNGEKRVAPQHIVNDVLLKKIIRCRLKPFNWLNLYLKYRQDFSIPGISSVIKSYQSKNSLKVVNIVQLLLVFDDRRLTKTVRWFVGLTSETKTTRKYQPTDNNDRLD